MSLGEDISRLVSRGDGEQLEIAFLEMMASDVAVDINVLGAFMASDVRAHALCMHLHTRGMHMHTSCMRTHTYAQKYRFRILAILCVLISFNPLFRSC